MAAPIDDKNVMADSVIYDLFDERNYVWDRNEALGFVCGIPTYARYDGNQMRLCIPSLAGGHGVNLVKYVNAWGKNIIERITGEPCDFEVSWEERRMKSFVIGDEDDCQERLIISFIFNGDMRVYFNRNQKK